MARTLAAALASAITNPVTAPGWLIAVTLTGAATTLRYSSRGDLTYDGLSYVGGAQIAVTRLAGVQSEVRLALPNTDNSASALLLAGYLSGSTASFSAYDAVAEAAEPLGALVVDALESLSATWAVLRLVTPLSVAAAQPALLLRPPLCNHLPPTQGTYLERVQDSDWSAPT